MVDTNLVFPLSKTDHLVIILTDDFSEVQSSLWMFIQEERKETLWDLAEL